MTAMLFRYVYFAGIDMSDIAFGLRWFMVRYARNLSGVSPERGPLAIIFIKNEGTRLALWQTE